ncbi:flagellar basal body L-ring protein FlgH [Oleisolibacter albus]|uniref:flagellar basal body L-ring protein FlgH n=1 Tax=Oleisolibacter albus TaxID=2171757 RepID=UPI000DF34550|nr:flagellar basal body L-ring protein FlgH [Oleisolibacter albus]
MSIHRPAALLLAPLLLAACADRLDHLGRAPSMTPIDDPARQMEAAGVSMPMPERSMQLRQPASLWESDARGFLRDLRANKVGDIVTVVIEMSEQAQISNQTTRSRGANEAAGLPNLFGFENKLGAVFPNSVDKDKLVNMNSSSSSSGNGAVNRKEQIQLKVAAVVTEILPNGNLVIAGRQEMRVNYELRELRIAGVIRPQDITTRNTVSYEKIAEARIAYGGRGQITDLQQPRVGQQVLDAILPF